MAKLNAEQTFRAKAPWFIGKLLADFPISVEDAAAIIGNAGHESLGFTTLQEIKPVVPGSRGGYGIMQWTGPRRRAYEAYCARNGLDPSSDRANYAYLFIELKGIEGSEKNAIPRTVAAKGLDAKVEAFEKAFLRAGVKHYASRKQWARVALDAWQKAGHIAPPPEVPARPVPPDKAAPQASPGAIIATVIVLAVLVAAFFILGR